MSFDIFVKAVLVDFRGKNRVICTMCHLKCKVIVGNDQEIPQSERNSERRKKKFFVILGPGYLIYVNKCKRFYPDMLYEANQEAFLLTKWLVHFRLS